MALVGASAGYFLAFMEKSLGETLGDKFGQWDEVEGVSLLCGILSSLLCPVAGSD